MQEIKDTVIEYEESHRKLRERINEFNEQLGALKSRKDNSGIKPLLERRTLMYSQLWDIEFAIRELREYLVLTGEAEVNKKVG